MERGSTMLAQECSWVLLMVLFLVYLGMSRKRVGGGCFHLLDHLPIRVSGTSPHASISIYQWN